MHRTSITRALPLVAAAIGLLLASELVASGVTVVSLAITCLMLGALVLILWSLVGR